MRRRILAEAVELKQLTDMFESVAVRPATAEDVPALRDVQLQAMQPLGREPFTQARWTEILDSFPRYYAYIAEDDASPFGYVTGGVPDEEYFRDRRCGELISVCLLPTHRARGYGRRLMVHGLTVLKRRMYERGIVWIQSDNEAGVQLARKLGFDVSGATREINASDRVIREDCFELDLTDFF